MQWPLRISVFLMAGLLAGCAPLPTVASLPPQSVAIKAEAPENIIANYILKVVPDKAGLKIAGVISEFPVYLQIFTPSDKSQGTVVIWIKGVEIADDQAPAGGEIKLTLSLSVFDGSGKTIYNRSITKRDHGIDSHDSNRKLEMVAKDALKEFIADSSLKVIMLKFKYGHWADLL